MKDCLATYFPALEEKQAEQLIRYYELLIAWNSRMNLTAITDKEEVAAKHFADSALPVKLLSQGASLIDVGSGAGFPGVVLKILRPDLKLTLLDSLGKRITFLETLCDELKLTDVRCIHARAEDGARMKELREHFDYATARAVSATAFLTEWLVPYLKVGAKALLYKGPQAEQELVQAEKAVKLLCCEAEIISFEHLSWGERKLIVLTKKKSTEKRFPRKAGTKEAL